MKELLEQWIQGRGFPDELVIDGHIHINGWPQGATFSSVEEAVEQSQRYLDGHGVDAFCSMGGSGFIRGDYRQGNDFLLALWRKIPERMIPFLGINPNDTRENILTELMRMYSEGVRGIKLINDYQYKYPGDGPNLMCVYEFAAKYNMLVVNHSWQSEVILKISSMFPATDFIFAHYGPHCDPALQMRDNVYANVWTYGDIGWLDRGIKNCGAGKFMLGSDGFLNPLSVGLGPVVFAPISDEEKRLILGLTMACLLNKANVLPEKIQKLYELQIDRTNRNSSVS